MKYRKNIFTNDAIVDFLKMNIREIAEKIHVDILCIEYGRDYFYMLFKYNPLLDIQQFINATKTITSREIQQNYPVVKKDFWRGKFRSSPYFIATSDQGTPGILEKYVEYRGIKHHRNI